MKSSRWLVAAAIWAAACGGAWGQWVTQEITLKEGWNAVCVRVEPVAGSLEAVGGWGGVEGVWRWDKRFTTAEYVVDEGSPLARDPHWKAWYPGEDVGFLSTLGEMSGWRCYLVKVREGAGERVVRIKGKAKLPRVEWYPNTLNLVGFPVGAAGVSFEEWFEADGAVDLSKWYDNGAWQIVGDGSERVVSKPELQKLSAGEAVWVRCDGASGYAGPLAVTTDAGSGLDFGAGLQKIGLTVANLSGTRARTVTLRLRDSEAAPAGEEQVAGGVPLYLAEGDGWVAFSEKTLELGPGESWKGTFGVHRTDMEWQAGDSSYQSVLGVRDGEGKIAIDVPVRAVRRPGAIDGASGAIHEVDSSVHPQMGLWVGEAVLTEVNCPNYQKTNEVTTMLPVRHVARLKLIVHVGADGEAALLKEAWVAAATNGSGMAVYASRDLVPAGTGDVWRASSATLPAMAPLGLGSGTNGLSGTLSGTVKLAYDNPVNPFLHRYHPLFDNKNGQFESYDGPVESKDVTRAISMEVEEEAESEDGGDSLADSSSAVSGTYQETLTGLRADDIVVKGRFALEKVVAGAELVAGGGE